ncbi:hypothetical protein CEXT_177681 [Caerostris extrusa]|uniref:Uncharacterized protein n=1 Tax=Caerostris extrusa TaxID=172846 RepID=A0AAV4MK83_CAEEX|nr:hypothetical protein CEXT_177681 [Caerostris extrusa]
MTQHKTSKSIQKCRSLTMKKCVVSPPQSYLGCQDFLPFCHEETAVALAFLPTAKALVSLDARNHPVVLALGALGFPGLSAAFVTLSAAKHSFHALQPISKITQENTSL